jgi:hypothetical protein
MRRARRQAKANRRLQALVRRLHGCLTDLPSTSARILTLRAGTAGHPGLSPGATAGVLGVSAGREAHAERVALSSLRAAGRAGCGSAGKPSTLVMAASHPLVASSPAFSKTTSVASGPTGASGAAVGSRTQTGGVTRSSVHRPGKGGAAPTRTVERAATEPKGTPAWGVILALGFVALAGAAAVGRQAVLGRRAGVAAGGAPPSLSPPPPPSASGSAIAALPAVAQSPPSDAVPTSSPHGTAPSEPAATPPAPPAASRPGPPVISGTAVELGRSTALPARTGSRRRGRVAAVVVAALAAGIVRLLSRRRPGRH